MATEDETGLFSLFSLSFKHRLRSRFVLK